MFFLSFLANFASAAQRGTLESSILYVGDSNFTDILNDKQAALVLLASDPDPDERFHVVADFISAGETLGTRCYFAVMNSERASRFSRTHKATDNYVYFFYRYGVLITSFSGQRTTEKLTDFAMSRTGIPFTAFDDYVAAQNFIEANPIAAVLFTDSLRGKSFDAFTKVANWMRDNASFGICPDEDIAMELEVEDSPVLVLYRAQDHAKIFYNDDIASSSAEDISEWIKYNMKPRFTPFKINSQKEYVGGRPVCLFFSPVDVEEQRENFKFISSLADQFGQDLEFAQIDAVKGNRFMTRIGFSKYADPAVAILDYKTKVPKKYLYDEEADWTLDDVSAFIMDFLDGKLQPLVRSSKLPSENNGPIIEVNSLTLEKTIEQKKDVLMLYYEPWDRVYTENLQMIENIAKKYSENVVFTRINVAENELIAGAKPKETPSFILYTKNGEVVKYKGRLIEKDLIAFLCDETDYISEL